MPRLGSNLANIYKKKKKERKNSSVELTIFFLILSTKSQYVYKFKNNIKTAAKDGSLLFIVFAGMCILVLIHSL